MVSDLKTFTNKVCKIAAQKKVCFWVNFALLSRMFLVLVLLSANFKRFSVSRMQNLFCILSFLLSQNYVFNEAFQRGGWWRGCYQSELQFIFSKNWPSWPILSISRNVRMFVRHTFSLRLTVFLPPLPEVQCPNFLDFRNS